MNLITNLSKIKGFLLWYQREYKWGYKRKRVDELKINIVCSDRGWIIYKFADKMCNCLLEMGIKAKISEFYDSDSDINHFFMQPYGMKVDEQSTFFITHVTRREYLERIKDYIRKGAIGICMSEDTHKKLISYGIAPNKICYILPAQDGKIRPRKIKLGFTHRAYSDNRKRESVVLDVCKHINPDIFQFQIMGAGWESIVSQMQDMGFDVTYYPNFDMMEYNNLITNLDYYCYFGHDEGSMGYLDAVAAGVGTIVTPQGYHLDSGIPISYPVDTIDDIIDALKEISLRYEKSIEFSNLWTWKNYTLKHIEIWKYQLGCESLDMILASRGWYKDGIYSLMLDSLDEYRSLKEIVTERVK